jgi:four helix bundle protein
VKCSTSVGANYRAARRARSIAEFISKLGIVEEEADESAYWLDVIVATDMMAAARVSDLRQEADEILAMVIASIRTAKKRRDSE